MRIRPLVTVGAAAAAAALLGACSSSGASGASGAAGPTSARTTSPVGNAANARNRGPAASGTIAAISGSTMQVQNPQEGQVAVTWTARTSFTQEVVVPSARITVGACVLASSDASSSSSSSSSAAADAPLTATRIVLTATAGCSGGGAFPGGQRPGGPPAQRQSGAFPSGPRPSGSPGGVRRMSVVAGVVTARSGSTLTIKAQRFGAATSSTRTVVLGAATKVYEQARATAKALAVGRCVTAQGSADSSGAVTATGVQVSQPVNGACTVGFGGAR